MNRNEFMKQLEYLLRNIPENEKQDALAYYDAYFDEAGIENEQKVIAELGSPENVAQTILADFDGQYETQGYGEGFGVSQDQSLDFNKKSSGMSQNQSIAVYEKGKENKKENKKIWIIVIAILTFPLWIGILAGLFGAVVGLLGGVFGIVAGLVGTSVGMVFASLALIVSGILCKSLTEALVIVGVGLLCLAIGLLMTVLITWILVKWLPELVRAIVNWCKCIWQRRKGGNEG